MLHAVIKLGAPSSKLKLVAETERALAALELSVSRGLPNTADYILPGTVSGGYRPRFRGLKWISGSAAARRVSFTFRGIGLSAGSVARSSKIVWSMLGYSFSGIGLSSKTRNYLIMMNSRKLRSPAEVLKRNLIKFAIFCLIL